MLTTYDNCVYTKRLQKTYIESLTKNLQIPTENSWRHFNDTVNFN